MNTFVFACVFHVPLFVLLGDKKVALEAELVRLKRLQDKELEKESPIPQVLSTLDSRIASAQKDLDAFKAEPQGVY